MLWNLASTVFLLTLSGKNSPSLCRQSRVIRLLSNAPNVSSNDQKNDSYDKLLQWIRSNDGEVNEKIEIRPSSRGGGYGAFASDTIEEGETLFTIPRTICLTLEDATEDKEAGDQIRKLIEKAGPGANTVVMAGYMATVYLKMLEDRENGKEMDGQWAPYFDTLPWERGFNDQEHILFWSDEMVESLLGGSSSYEEAKGLRGEVDLAIKVMSGVFGQQIRRYRGEDVDDAGFSWPWEKKPVETPDGFPEAVKGAFVSLLTRSFQDGGNESEEEKLVPLLDMLQHSDKPNIRHAMRKADGTVEVSARHLIEANEELLNQYQSEEEDNMPYSRFFTRFGFVPGIMEPVESLLKDKSSIFFPQKAEI